MQDINPIMLWFPINVLYSIIFILFLVWLYFLWKNLDKKGWTQGSPLQNECRGEPCVHPKPNYLKQLKILEEEYLDKNKEIFYAKLSKILKNIIMQQGSLASWKDITKMTFTEINKLEIKQNLKDLIKNIYFKEYMKEIEDSEEIRKNLILEVKKYTRG